MYEHNGLWSPVLKMALLPISFSSSRTGEIYVSSSMNQRKWIAPVQMSRFPDVSHPASILSVNFRRWVVAKKNLHRYIYINIRQLLAGFYFRRSKNIFIFKDAGYDSGFALG